jgi:hypothetical protein
MGKSAPKAPDYEAAAERQAQSSREVTEQQTWANRPDQVTPFGNQTWQSTPTYDPATGQTLNRWQQTTELDPEMQRALDAQTNLTVGRSEIGAGMLDRIQSEFDPVVDFGQFSPAGGQVRGGTFRGDLGGADAFMGRAGDALISQFESWMAPKFEREGAQFDATLRARGLKPGDQGYDQGLADLRKSQNDQFNQAMYQAQQLTSAEGSRMQDMDQQSIDAMNRAISSQFGQDVSQSGFDTQIRQQQIAELMARRGLSLNEANALISGQQVAMPNMPSFNTANRAEATQYNAAAQNQYQASLDAFNAEQAALSGMVGAVTSPFSFGFGG